MIAFSCLALLLLLPGVWLFARGHSNTHRIDDVRNFNRGVWILSAVLTALCAGYFWLTTGHHAVCGGKLGASPLRASTRSSDAMSWISRFAKESHRTLQPLVRC